MVSEISEATIVSNMDHDKTDRELLEEMHQSIKRIENMLKAKRPNPSEN